MNIKVIRYVLGLVLMIEAVLLLLPFIVGLIYQENTALAFLKVAAASFIVGFLLSRKKPSDFVFYLKEGCITTALSWIVISAVGALPFMITGEIPHFIDAFFETVSGFTTTGASILKDVEALSHASLFWRSFTHWVGGMGVLVFLLAIIPLSGGSNINLMKAESPGPSVGKLVPKIRSSAAILYEIYFGMTLLQIVLLLFAKMDLFSALCMAFGSAGTGGFGIRNSSCADYSAAQQWIIAVFMMLFGVNFNFYYFALHKDIKRSLKMEEVRWYIIIIASSTLLIFLQIGRFYGALEPRIRSAFFQVSSIITTTGYSTTDFNAWSPNCQLILLLIMCIGACAGSTGGGLKVSRTIILFKAVGREIRSYVHPKSVRKIRIDGEPVADETVNSTMVYMAVYTAIFALSIFLVSLDGKSFMTSFSAVAATFNNIGPGFDLVGPASNYSMLSGFSKFVLSFDMLAGRLEIFPMLLLFTPSVWKKTGKQETHNIKARML